MDQEEKELEIEDGASDVSSEPQKNNKSGRFNVMPDEFFSFKYQQSRVRKEQQMRMEKEEIDRKKQRQEEKIKRILEREKIQKEKDENRKRMQEIKEQENKKKQEEAMILAQKKQEEKEKRAEAIRKIREEQERVAKQKQDEARRILELRKKAIGEKRDYEKTNKEELKSEVDRINQLKESTDYTKLSKAELAEFNKKIEREKKEALEKMKEQQKLNKIEQIRIIKEAKEEEKRKRKEAQDALRIKNRAPGEEVVKKKLDLSFIKDLERRLSPKQTTVKKIILIIFILLMFSCSFLLLKSTFGDFKSLKNVVVAIFSKEKKINKNYSYGYTYGNEIKGSYGSYGYGEDDIKNINISYGDGIIPNGVNINESNYGYANNTSNENVNAVQETDNKEFFRLFFSKNKFNIGVDSDNDFLTDQEEAYYDTSTIIADVDGDLYSDGEEVSNLYDPNKVAPSKIIDSGLVSVFDNNFISFYYPKNFKYRESNYGEMITIMPDLNSREYFEISSLKNSGNFLDFIKKDLDSDDINLLKIKIPNESYIDSMGKSVYIKFNDTDIIKIKYINDLAAYNYSATFSMLIRSLMLK